ncbi:hypothetical protein TWF694_003452 [Orbilia ellipsospora]|uniref:Uncharacterized protein n=1 Tax=Orbilia ellipsospora TaxID=2528407 RepID=A0AAV9X465_9PEZI
MHYSRIAVSLAILGSAAAVPLSSTPIHTEEVPAAATFYALPNGSTNLRTPAGTGNEGPLSHQDVGSSDNAIKPQLPPVPTTISCFPYTTTLTAYLEKTATTSDVVIIYVASSTESASVASGSTTSSTAQPLTTLYADKNGNTNIETPAGSTGDGLAHQMHSDDPAADIPQFPAAPSGVSLPYTTTYSAGGERNTDEAKVVVYIDTTAAQ